MTPRALATDRSLADFHAARAILYAAFAELLEGGVWGPRAARGLALSGDDELVSRLHASPPDAVLRERRLLGRRSTQLDLCREPLVPLRCESFVVAGATPGETRPDEIALLARFAALTSAAIRTGDLVTAARLSEAGSRFLREHAAPCLAAYTADLEASGAPLLGALGRALARSVARDVTLNGAPDGRALSS